MKYLWFAVLITCLMIVSAAWMVTGSSLAAFASGVFGVMAIHEFLFEVMAL